MKLETAPLIEVIFELRWKISDKKELEKSQYLHGDLYAKIKDEYPHREALNDLPIELCVNIPTHRFRGESDKYPLVQVGPGILTFNTVHPQYEWTSYEKGIIKLWETFQDVYRFEPQAKVTYSLQYFNFFNLDFEKVDAYKFINEKLNVKFEQNFYKNLSPPININTGFYYDDNPGSVAILFNRGSNSKNDEGIIIQTRVTSKLTQPLNEGMKSWLSQSHELCSNLFKKMIRTNP
jgi:uncharacterized protein (TIGR04255 family)